MANEAKVVWPPRNLDPRGQARIRVVARAGGQLVVQIRGADATGQVVWRPLPHDHKDQVFDVVLTEFNRRRRLSGMPAGHPAAPRRKR